MKIKAKIGIFWHVTYLGISSKIGIICNICRFQQFVCVIAICSIMNTMPTPSHECTSTILRNLKLDICSPNQSLETTNITPEQLHIH